MSELDIVLASYRDMFGVKTDLANEIHRLACEEVARLRAAQPSVQADRDFWTCPECKDSNHKDLLVCGGCETPRRN